MSNMHKSIELLTCDWLIRYLLIRYNEQLKRCNKLSVCMIQNSEHSEWDLTVWFIHLVGYFKLIAYIECFFFSSSPGFLD